MHTGAPPGAPRYRVMFTVPFRTAMSDSDIHRLTRVLGMSTHPTPAVLSPATPGVARLYFFSGLSCFVASGWGSGDWRAARGRAGRGDRARLASGRG